MSYFNNELEFNSLRNISFISQDTFNKKYDSLMYTYESLYMRIIRFHLPLSFHKNYPYFERLRKNNVQIKYDIYYSECDINSISTCHPRDVTVI